MKCSLSISNFLFFFWPLFFIIIFFLLYNTVLVLHRPLVFLILLFSSISLHWSLRKAFLSLLAILWNSLFKQVYLSFSPLPLASLLFSAICNISSDNHFAFLHFFFLGMVLITASYQFSSVQSLSRVWLCDPMNRSTPVLPSIKVFSNESTLRMRWPKY